MLRKQLSIQEQGGIAQYLDDTRADHHGHGYTEFMLYQRLEIPKTVQAKLMNVSPDTIRNWLKLLAAKGETQ